MLKTSNNDNKKPARPRMGVPGGPESGGQSVARFRQTGNGQTLKIAAFVFHVASV
jgi:hypothetical protein